MIVSLDEGIKSRILQDFDRLLQSEFSTDLYSLVSNIKFYHGESFHDTVDIIFERDGAKGLREFFLGLINMLNSFLAENALS